MGSDQLNANKVTKVAGQSLQCRFQEDFGAPHKNSFQRFVLPTEATRFSSYCYECHLKYTLASRSLFGSTAGATSKDLIQYVAPGIFMSSWQEKSRDPNLELVRRERRDLFVRTFRPSPIERNFLYNEAGLRQTHTGHRLRNARRDLCGAGGMASRSCGQSCLVLFGPRCVRGRCRITAGTRIQCPLSRHHALTGFREV